MLCLSLKFEVTILYSNENAQCMSSGGADTLIFTLLKLPSQGHPRTLDLLALIPFKLQQSQIVLL